MRKKYNGVVHHTIAEDGSNRYMRSSTTVNMSSTSGILSWLFDLGNWRLLIRKPTCISIYLATIHQPCDSNLEQNGKKIPALEM